jgi:dTDP-4-amino-4,6-dideoxygalactose transaminase
MAVDIFGQSANMKELKKIAKKHSLKIISDTAQAPGALYNKKYAGTLADIGGYSLNYHKHIHCGEGGILVTNDYDLAQRLRMLRNHAEAVIDSNSPNELCNMLGFNFRMGEIEASIASCQLDKLNTRVLSRQIVAANLNEGLSSLKGLKTPRVSDESTHVYYVYGLTLDLDLINTTREKIISALEAEGVPGIMRGYQNLHLLPMFRNKIAYGTSGFPWSSDFCTSNVEYKEGLCPIAEELHSKTFFGLNICMYELDEKDVDLVISSFKKVWESLELL